MFFKKQYIKDIENIKKTVDNIEGYCFWLEDNINLIKEHLNIKDKLTNIDNYQIHTKKKEK